MARPLTRSRRSYPAIVVLGALLIHDRPCFTGRVLSRPARNRPGPLSAVALIGSCAGFVVLGAMQALYGPAIPAFRATFGVSPSVAGLGLSADFTGALAGIVIFHLLRSALGDRRLLACSYALIGLGTAGFALAPSWTLALTAALVTGLGAGGIDYGLNHLFAIGFGHRSAAMLNLLNAFFGVGAVIGPVLIGGVGADRYPWLFGGVAVAAVLVIPTLAGVHPEQAVHPRPEEPFSEIKGARTPVIPSGRRSIGLIVAAFVAIYVLYVAIESGVGGWEPTHLEAVGYSATFAATATAAFWLALTVGRFLAVPVSLRWPAPAIVTGCCAGMALFLLLAAIPAVAPWAYGGLGFMCAPIWATGLPWLTRAAPRVAAASAYVMAISMLGGIVFPPLLGRAIEVAGVRSVPIILCVVAAACTVLSLWLRRATAAARRNATGQELSSANEP
jgi:MFS transporter, FHS family, glucose/mannose:H+ symporter